MNKKVYHYLINDLSPYCNFKQKVGRPQTNKKLDRKRKERRERQKRGEKRERVRTREQGKYRLCESALKTLCKPVCHSKKKIET